MEIEKVSKLTKREVERLKDFGVENSDDLIYIGEKALSNLLEIPENRAREIVRECYRYYEIKLMPASELIRVEVDLLETPLRRLNEVFGGGIRSRTVTEVYGKFGAGKTNFLMTLSVDCAKRGLKVIWFDSEGTFSLDRIRQIAEARYGDVSMLKDILVKRVGHSDEVIIASIILPKIIKKVGARVLVFDSLVAPFRSDYVGLENLVERQQNLNYVLRNLLRYAEIFNLWVFFSNQVVAQISPFESYVPVGGHVVAHMSSYIFELKKKRSKRFLILKDVPELPEIEIPFKISDRGVEDFR